MVVVQKILQAEASCPSMTVFGSLSRMTCRGSQLVTGHMPTAEGTVEFRMLLTIHLLHMVVGQNLSSTPVSVPKTFTNRPHQGQHPQKGA